MSLNLFSILYKDERINYGVQRENSFSQLYILLFAPQTSLFERCLFSSSLLVILV